MTRSEFDIFCRDMNRDMLCCIDNTGRFLMVNNSSLVLTGYHPDELTGKYLYDFVHEHKRPLIEKMLQGYVTSVRHRFITKDNTELWLETEIIPAKSHTDAHCLIISRDISAIMNLREELDKREALFNEAEKMAEIGTWELDVSTMIPNWSKVTYDIHELDYDYPLDLNKAINFFKNDSKTSLLTAIGSAIDQAQPYDLTLTLVTEKNNHIWVRAIGKPIMVDNKVVRLVGTIQNISKEVEARNILKPVVKQLTNQNKQLEEFNHILSHNVRSPIASLSMLLALYESSSDEDEKKELFELLKSSAESLNTLMNELVDMLKVLGNKEIESETNDIAAIINKTTDLLKGEILKYGVTIRLELEDWHTIIYPKMYLESILLNLMSNAIKYRSEERKPVIIIRTLLLDGCKVMTFADNGSGIDMQRYGDKVFKLYKTFHRQKPGKGMGLFMTKSQIESMGGEIHIESQPGKGTMFTIIFDKQKHFNVS